MKDFVDDSLPICSHFLNEEIGCLMMSSMSGWELGMALGALKCQREEDLNLGGTHSLTALIFPREFIQFFKKKNTNGMLHFISSDLKMDT